MHTGCWRKFPPKGRRAKVSSACCHQRLITGISWSSSCGKDIAVCIVRNEVESENPAQMSFHNQHAQCTSCISIPTCPPATSFQWRGPFGMTASYGGEGCQGGNYTVVNPTGYHMPLKAAFGPAPALTVHRESWKRGQGMTSRAMTSWGLLSLSLHSCSPNSLALIPNP